MEGFESPISQLAPVAIPCPSRNARAFLLGDYRLLRQVLRVLFIEVKAKNGTVKALQQYRIDELKRHGIDAIVKYAPY